MTTNPIVTTPSTPNAPSMIANRLKAVKPSPTLMITSKAIAMKNQGLDVISLSAGEPDFDTPENVKMAAIKAIHEGKTKYTPVEGTKELKEAIVNKLKKENNLIYNTNQVVVGNGAKQIIFNAFLATLNAGDEVIIPAPFWVSYPDMVLVAEGTPVIINCSMEDDFKLQPDALDKAITNKTKWLILNSPSNPTGVVYTKQELKALSEVLMKHKNVYVLTDDIYEHIIFNGATFYTITQIEPNLSNRTLVVNGLSKSHAMTGWRIGYGAGPLEIMQAIGSLQSHSTSNASSISQAAAVEALNGPQDILEKSKKLFESRCNLVMDLLKNAKGLRMVKPDGAFYLFINCEKLIGKKTKDNLVISDSNIFGAYLLEKYLVAVVPGEAFGAVNHFRISYATSEKNLIEACKRIVEACNSID